MRKSDDNPIHGGASGRKLFSRSCILAAYAATVPLSAAAQAQGSSAVLDEIVVTARGIEVSERDTPVSISVMDAEALQKMDLTNMEDVAANTPSVTIVRAGEGSGATINIRGVGSTFSSIGIEQSVATIIDGVYYPQGRVLNESLFDSKQISVLKGPQALYFGKNATAGVVSVETKGPGNELEVKLGGGYEFEADASEVNAIISGPITESLGARLALRATDASDGLWDNPSRDTNYTTYDVANGGQPTTHFNPALDEEYWPGEESTYSRLTVDYMPNDVFRLNVKGSYSEIETNGSQGNEERINCTALPGGTPHSVDPGTGDPVPVNADCEKDWSDPRQAVPPSVAMTNSMLNRFDGQMGEQYSGVGLTVKSEFNLDLGTVSAILNHHDQKTDWVLDSDHSRNTAVMAAEHNTFENNSAEFRFVSEFSGPLNLIAGAYYQETDRFFNQSVITASAQNSAAPDPANEFIAFEKLSETEGETKSVYGELIWDITDQLQFTGGARWIDETKDSYFVHPYVNPNLLAVFTKDQTIEANQSFEETIPEATLRWTPRHNVMAYVAYKEGFKSGGFSNSGILGAISSTLEDFIFDPESAEGFEGGVKTEFFDNDLMVDLTVYHYEYEGLQIDFFNTPIFAFTTSNAGASTAEGIELDLQWSPIEGLRIDSSLAYNKSEYGDFVGPCYVGQAPSQGCTIDLNVGGTAPKQQLSGEPTALAPEWVGSVGVDYDRAITGSMLAGFTLNIQSRSEHVTSSFGHPADEQSGYTTVDAALRVGHMDGRWELSLIGKNLTDKYALVASRGVPSTGGRTGTEDAFNADRRAFAIQPRTVALKASYNFF